MTDPRIDPLGASAILTDTQVRVSFAPSDPDERVIALKSNSRAANLLQMQGLKAAGVPVYVIDSFEAVDKFIRSQA